jgi:hypothetical protein
MSYSARLNDESRRKIGGWKLSSHVIREILDGLDRLALNPPRHLIRIGPPDDTLQFDVAARDPGPPALDYLISLSVRYHADEETLLIYDCDYLVLDVETGS